MTQPPPESANTKGAVESLEARIREVPDFPRKGISFKDITPLIENGEALHAAVEALARATAEVDFDAVLCAEARGFVFGTALAYKATKGLVLARKPDKLPRQTISASYELEYGRNTLEVHADAMNPQTRVLVVDDLLATGGTARAMCDLVENSGAHVAAVAVLVELAFLGGRDALAPHHVVSVISYDSAE